MIEKQHFNGKDVWIKVDAHPIERENPNIIPKEYFTVSFYNDEPSAGTLNGVSIKDEDGAIKLFESPVAALTAASKYLQNMS
jgi:hypothetical protein